MILQPGDLGFSASRSPIGSMIRGAQRAPLEGPSEASHAWGVTIGGNPWESWIVEAVGGGVVEHRLADHYLGRQRQAVLVARPINLLPNELGVIVDTARSFIGRRYGFGQLFFHLVDSVVSGVLGRDVMWARKRIAKSKRLTCGRTWALAYRVAGATFGVEADAADPDAMLDFIRRHPDKWQIIHEWGPLA